MEKLILQTKLNIDDKKNNLIIYSDKINYDVNNQKIFGQGNSENNR